VSWFNLPVTLVYGILPLIGMARSFSSPAMATFLPQLIDYLRRRAAERALDEISLLVVRIGDADEADARHLGEHAGVVVPHDAHPDDADAQRGCIGFHGFYPGHATPDS